MYDYFYGQQAELFSFYRVPKVLFTDEKFSNISSDAKLLYGIMLDRMNLSAKNGWVDELGRVYIIFTIEEVKGALGCAEKKAVKLLHELENKCGLIERKRIGLGKPNYIYVKNFVDNCVERQFLNCQKDNSGTVNKTLQELSKAQGNNTDIKDTDYSDTDPILSSDFSGRDVEKDEEFQSYYQYFYEELEMDYLFREFPYDKEVLESILEILVETVCSKRKLIRIASDDKPSEVVRSRLMKLNSEHIRYVLLCVQPAVFSCRVCISKDDLMQTLFWMEESKGGGDIYDCIQKWEDMRAKYETGEISKEEYLQWKLTYICTPLTDTSV